MQPFSSFYPITQLNRTDADVMVNFILMGDISFLTRINDPIFSAHQEGPVASNWNGSEVPTYFADFPAGATVCTLQVNMLRWFAITF